MKALCLLILSFVTLMECGIVAPNQENCEDIPTSNAISYDGQSNIDNEMIDASRTQNFHLLKCLIQNGANINAEKDGISALIYAAAYGSFDIAKFLVDNGANVNAANSDGQSVLTFAASSAYTAAILGPKDHIKMVRYLITQGNADVNGVTKAGDTALIWAARNGHQHIVKLLISLGADINIVDNKGYSALLWATQNEHYEITKELVLFGAEINATITEGDFAGYTTLTFASRRGDDGLFDFLIENGAVIKYDEEAKKYIMQ